MSVGNFIPLDPSMLAKLASLRQCTIKLAHIIIYNIYVPPFFIFVGFTSSSASPRAAPFHPKNYEKLKHKDTFNGRGSAANRALGGAAPILAKS